jgi:hypothetical protein
MRIDEVLFRKGDKFILRTPNRLVVNDSVFMMTGPVLGKG